MVEKKDYKSGDTVEFKDGNQKALIKIAQERIASANYGIRLLSDVARTATGELFKLSVEFIPDLKDYEYTISSLDEEPKVVIKYKRERSL